MSASSPAITTTLSSKCSICFTSTPKYRCPRCAARTCSLNCVRTHKSRSLCSGIRDATGYLSRRQLATDKAFDSDFNLLSRIERGVERAERVFAVASGNLGSERRIHKAIEQAGVRVWRAPKGVKRARESRTGLEGRRQSIRWTIEWKFLGMSVISSASELVSLNEAHDIAVLDAYMSGLERIEKQRIEDYARSAGVLVPNGYKGRKDLVDILRLKHSPKPLDDQTHVIINDTTQEYNDMTTAQSNEVGFPPDSDTNEAAPQLNRGVNMPDVNTAKRKFFIHRPEISSAKEQIVSLVDGMTSLRDVLNGKTVREFPTFLIEVPDFDQIDWTQWHVEDEVDGSKTV